MNYIITLFNTQPILIPFITLIIALLVKFTYEHLFESIFKKTKTLIDDEIIKSLENSIFWSILLVGIHIFLNYLNIPENYLNSISNLLKTLALLIWIFALKQIFTILILALGKRQNSSEKLVDIIPMLKTITKLVLLAIALITFKIWGIDITPILASAGIVGFAIAFAAKDTVSNLFGGISVFFDRPYAVRNYVIIDEKYRGEIIEIGIRSTKIQTRDDVLLTVPNSVMITKAVINETGLDGKLRVRVPIGIAQRNRSRKSRKNHSQDPQQPS